MHFTIEKRENRRITRRSMKKKTPSETKGCPVQRLELNYQNPEFS
jgi:hypothetical protein